MARLLFFKSSPERALLVKKPENTWTYGTTPIPSALEKSVCLSRNFLRNLFDETNRIHSRKIELRNQ